MADGPLHSGWSGLECLGDLRVQYFGDGIGVLTARLGAFWMQPENSMKIEADCRELIAFFIVPFATALRV